MPTAWDEFNNSYIKSAFKPNSDAWYGSPFRPDSAFGANMLPGSERINPSANRDVANAGFGWRGATGVFDNLLKLMAGDNQSDLLSLLQGG